MEREQSPGRVHEFRLDKKNFVTAAQQEPDHIETR